MILKAVSGCAKLIFLPMRFCAPYPGVFAHLTQAILRTISIYIIYSIIYACHDALMPIKLFDYSYYSTRLTFFLHKPTYSCYKLQIPKLQTIDTKLTNF